MVEFEHEEAQRRCSRNFAVYRVHSWSSSFGRSIDAGDGSSSVSRPTAKRIRWASSEDGASMPLYFCCRQYYEKGEMPRVIRLKSLKIYGVMCYDVPICITCGQPNKVLYGCGTQCRARVAGRRMDVDFSRGGIAQGVCAACRYCPACMLRMPGAQPLRQPPNWLMQNGFITHTCTTYAEAVPFKDPGNHRLGDCRADAGRYHVQRGCLSLNPDPPTSGQSVGSDMEVE